MSPEKITGISRKRATKLGSTTYPALNKSKKEETQSEIDSLKEKVPTK